MVCLHLMHRACLPRLAGMASASGLSASERAAMTPQAIWQAASTAGPPPPTLSPRGVRTPLHSACLPRLTGMASASGLSASERAGMPAEAIRQAASTAASKAETERWRKKRESEGQDILEARAEAQAETRAEARAANKRALLDGVNTGDPRDRQDRAQGENRWCAKKKCFIPKASAS